MNITTKINNIISKTNEHTANIKHYQENTYPEWISDDGSGSPFAYDKFTAVKYTDGNIYYSLVDNNDEEPTTGSNWSQFPITPASSPTTDYQVANKKYVDDNITPGYNPTPTIATGIATFTATTNNINLTGIGIGVELGDVIQISGAEDVKNNSEFTVEVITDNDNIIVNQAHANKGTTKNVANRAGDTGVAVKLLAKWYNAPIGLGQGWVNVTASRVAGTTYPNNTNRTISVSITGAGNPSSSLELLVNGNITKKSLCYEAGTTSHALIDAKIPKLDSYRINTVAGSILYFFELR